MSKAKNLLGLLPEDKGKRSVLDALNAGKDPYTFSGYRIAENPNGDELWAFSAHSDKVAVKHSNGKWDTNLSVFPHIVQGRSRKAPTPLK